MGALTASSSKVCVLQLGHVSREHCRANALSAKIALTTARRSHNVIIARACCGVSGNLQTNASQFVFEIEARMIWDTVGPVIIEFR